MGSLAGMLVIAAGIVLGVLVQRIGVTHSGYDGFITGIAVVGGAIVAGQWLGGATTWGPQFDGLYLLPALIGGLVLGAIADLAVRFAFQATAAA